MTAKKCISEFKRSLVYKGVPYKSIRSLCQFLNVNYSVFTYRLRAGATLEEAASPERKQRVWTKQKCIDLSAKYKTTKDFRRDNASAWANCERNGWVDLLQCERIHKAIRWTRDHCIALSLVVENTERYRNDHNAAWLSCVRNGWTDDLLCEHINVKRYKPDGYWTKERIQLEALKYTHMKEMERENRAAYNAAKRMGITKEIGAHMMWQRRTDYDTLYILKTNQMYKGMIVYKVGVTSWRLGLNRFNVLDNLTGYSHQPVFHHRVSVKATIPEHDILKIGESPEYDGFKGCTEYRAWGSEELWKAMKIANAFKATDEYIRSLSYVDQMCEQLGFVGM